MSEHLCPHCHKPIYDDEALLCLFCGESLQRPVGTLGKFKYAGSVWPWITAAIVCILVVMIFLIY